ncbi:MAG: prephenate dehydrogenase [Phycisphaeraceae bacterium]
MLDGVDKLVIVGTGLLGASVGLAAKAAGFRGRIVGVARREEVGRVALERGCVDEISLDAGEAAKGAGLIVVAVPLGGFEAVFHAIREPVVASSAVVTDVGSTKAGVMRLAQEIFGQGAKRVIGAHPMAGSEQAGPEAATAELLRGKPCVITAGQQDDADAIELVEQLWRGVGMSVVRMDPDEHDRCMAAVSHLPHLAAVGLIGVVSELGGWQVASTGLKDTSRLASSNPPMRADIIHENREALAEVLRGYAKRITAMAELVERDDQTRLLELLESAKAKRDTWLAEREAES